MTIIIDFTNRQNYENQIIDRKPLINKKIIKTIDSIWLSSIQNLGRKLFEKQSYHSAIQGQGLSEIEQCPTEKPQWSGEREKQWSFEDWKKGHFFRWKSPWIFTCAKLSKRPSLGSEQGGWFKYTFSKISDQNFGLGCNEPSCSQRVAWSNNKRLCDVRIQTRKWFWKKFLLPTINRTRKTRSILRRKVLRDMSQAIFQRITLLAILPREPKNGPRGI